MVPDHPAGRKRTTRTPRSGGAAAEREHGRGQRDGRGHAGRLEEQAFPGVDPRDRDEDGADRDRARDEAREQRETAGGDPRNRRAREARLERPVAQLADGEQPGRVERGAGRVCVLREGDRRGGAEREQRPRDDDRSPPPETGGEDGRRGCRQAGREGGEVVRREDGEGAEDRGACDGREPRG